MKNKKVTIKDDNGRDCVIENIQTFHKHLQMFHKKGVSVHDENGHYFTVDDSFRQQIDELVDERSWWITSKAGCNDNCTIQRKREEIKKGRDGEEKGTEEGLDEEETEGDYRSGSDDDWRRVWWFTGTLEDYFEEP